MNIHTPIIALLALSSFTISYGQVRNSTTTLEETRLETTPMSSLVQAAVSNAPVAVAKAGLKFYAHSDPAILGNRLAFFDVGFTDSDALDETVTTWSFGLNIPYKENWNFGPSFSYNEVDFPVLVQQQETFVDFEQRFFTTGSGIFTRRFSTIQPVQRSRTVFVPVQVQREQLNAGLSLTYAFKPGEKSNPFLGAGLGASKVEVTAGSTTVSDTSYGGGIFGGIEYKVNDRTGIIPSIQYVRGEDSDNDDVILSLLGNHWLTGHAGIRGGVTYSTEVEEASLNIGALIAF